MLKIIIFWLNSHISPNDFGIKFIWWFEWKICQIKSTWYKVYIKYYYMPAFAVTYYCMIIKNNIKNNIKKICTCSFIIKMIIATLCS